MCIVHAAIMVIFRTGSQVSVSSQKSRNSFLYFQGQPWAATQRLKPDEIKTGPAGGGEAQLGGCEGGEVRGGKE